MESEGRSFVESIRQRVQPPMSHRTLCHPSFMPLYANPGVTPCCGHNQTVPHMSPQEFFYTDPNINGTRIPNHVHELKDFGCFQLNTPPPVMSACVAPTSCPDPFRTGQHLTRNLGSSSWDMGAPLPPARRMWVMIQLTQEEDQAVTNLLKLHHDEGRSPTQQLKVEDHLGSNKHSPSLHPHLDQSHELLRGGFNSREDRLGTSRMQWSDTELEVANILLTQFGTTGEVNDINSRCGRFLLPSDSNVSEITDFPVHEQVLSKLEGDALCGLLNLKFAQS